MNQQHRPHKNDFQGRLGALEQSMDHVQGDVSAIMTKLDSLDSKLDSKSGVPWQPIMAVGAVIISVFALFTSPLQVAGDYRDKAIDQIIQMGIEQQAHFRDHEKLDGHPTALNISNNLKEELEEFKKYNREDMSNLDEVLQREMRLLASANTEAIESLRNNVDQKFLSQDDRSEQRDIASNQRVDQAIQFMDERLQSEMRILRDNAVLEAENKYLQNQLDVLSRDKRWEKADRIRRPVESSE